MHSEEIHYMLNEHLKNIHSQEEEDAQQIMTGKPYHWRDWSIALDERGLLYLWSDAVVLQLYKDSPGWFCFVLDGNVSFMNLEGTSENVPDEFRKEFLEKLLAVQSQMETGLPSQPILSDPNLPFLTRLLVGYWSLVCDGEGNIRVRNSSNQETITLKKDFPGFMFHPNITMEKIPFIAKNSLGPEFPAGWAKRKEKRCNAKSKLEGLKQKKNRPAKRAKAASDNIPSFHEKESAYRPTNSSDCSATMLLKDADNHHCKLAEEYNEVLEMDVLSKNLKDLFTNENCWDTVLQVGDKEFKVHRAILSARSTVFLAMFQHDTSEKQTGLLNIPDCDPDSFKKFLEYVYCGKLENISSDCAVHLYAISDKYNVQELKLFCIKYLTHNITTENICEVIILADAYDETQLFSAVQDYFNENFKEIVITSDWENLMKKNFRLANKLLIEKSKAE